MMLYVGSVQGGPEIEKTSIDVLISKLIQFAEESRKSISNDWAALNVVFYISGSIIGVDFEGLRTGKFSKKQKLLMIQVAVPNDIQESELKSFLLDSLRGAAEVALPVFQKARIEFDTQGYLRLIDSIEARLCSE